MVVVVVVERPEVRLFPPLPALLVLLLWLTGGKYEVLVVVDAEGCGFVDVELCSWVVNVLALAEGGRLS